MNKQHEQSQDTRCLSMQNNIIQKRKEWSMEFRMQEVIKDLKRMQYAI